MRLIRRSLLSAFLLSITLLLITFAKGAACEEPKRQSLEIVRVVDGDTIVVRLNGRRESLRLIGIDTPESSDNEKARRDSSRNGKDLNEIIKLGKIAKQYLISILHSGDTFSLEFDVEKRDHYGRLLGYLYRSDGTMINALIIREGYASPMTVPPNVRCDQIFREAFKDARTNNRGLWGKRGQE